MSQNQYFRVGAGSVIYNDQGEILLFSRTDNPTIWQLQQGGMDEGETMDQTLWRELFEETALTEADFEQVDKYPDWLLYEYTWALRPELKDPNCLGVEIDITKAVDKEFSEAKWVSFDHLLELPDTLKKDVYKALSKYFIENIQK